MANRLKEFFNRTVIAGLAASTFVASTPALSDEPPPDNTASPTARPLLDERLASTVNTLIIEEAARNALALMPLGKTSYSQQLANLDRDYRQLYREVFGNNAPPSRVVLLDPAEVAVGTALGIDTHKIVQMITQREGVALDDKFTQLIRNTQRTPFQTALWSSYKTDASAFSPYITPELHDCVITPMMPYGLVTGRKIDGMSPVDQVRMLNNHEKWHCLHRDFTLNAAQFDEKTPSEQVFLSEIRGESFADQGMAGDEIISGKPYRAVIDSITKTRAGNGHILMNGKHAGGDYSHLTIVALQKLATEIEKMGVERFKNLSAIDRVALYKDIAITTAPNLPTIIMMDKFLEGRLSQQDISTPTGLAAVELAQNILLHQPSTEGLFDIPPQSKNEQIKELVTRFDPKGALEERAISLSGEITPRSMILAHASLQSGYYQAMQTDDTLTYQGLSAKLQASFVNIVKLTDYIEANQRHNIDPRQIVAFKHHFEEASRQRWLINTATTPSPSTPSAPLATSDQAGLAPSSLRSPAQKTAP